MENLEQNGMHYPLHDNRAIGTNNSIQEKIKFFDLRITSLKESNERLEILNERIESLELHLTGTRLRDNKTEKTHSDDPSDDPSEGIAVEKTSIINELNEVNGHYNNIILKLEDCVGHLEEII
ncbi:MAG: hypothetical protein PF487_14610 [Bacteroidales bacterium]|jgi:hypothetical protein|nr:hypothetical protein [Bacteroidales bacterium]